MENDGTYGGLVAKEGEVPKYICPFFLASHCDYKHRHCELGCRLLRDVCPIYNETFDRMRENIRERAHAKKPV